MLALSLSSPPRLERVKGSGEKIDEDGHFILEHAPSRCTWRSEWCGDVGATARVSSCPPIMPMLAGEFWIAPWSRVDNAKREST